MQSKNEVKRLKSLRGKIQYWMSTEIHNQKAYSIYTIVAWGKIKAFSSCFFRLFNKKRLFLSHKRLNKRSAVSDRLNNVWQYNEKRPLKMQRNKLGDAVPKYQYCKPQHNTNVEWPYVLLSYSPYGIIFLTFNL